MQYEGIIKAERSTVWNERAGYFMDANNERIWVGDSVLQTDVYTRHLKVKQVHSLLDVPVLLEYSMPLSSFHLSLQAGSVFNVYHRFSGKVLSQDSDIVDHDDQEIYCNRVGLSWRGALRLSRSLGLKNEVYVQVQYTHGTGSFLRDDYPLRAMYGRPGINMGLRHYF